MRRTSRALSLGGLALSLAFAGACGPSLHGSDPDFGGGLDSLRASADGSSDGELVGRWALAEMIAPGGKARRAEGARRKLDGLHHDGLYGSLARAIADEVHGEPRSAADAYVDALKAASTSEDPEAPLVAWLAAHNLIALRGSVAGLYQTHRQFFDGLLAAPGNIGWRALGDIAEWWAVEVSDRAEETGDAYDALVAKRLGCATAVRLAGPFGHGVSVDRNRTFPAELPGPWPTSWAPDATRGTVPHVLSVERHHCLVASTESVPDGVFYAETFFDAPSEREVLVSVRGAAKVWVDDTPVLTRDPAVWGSLERYGVSVRVQGGRHRVLARVLGVVSSVALLNHDGSPADVTTSDDGSAPYALDPPELLADPNPIHELVQHPQGAPPLRSFLGAFAANADGLDDVAAVLMEPLVTSPHPAALSLVQAADYAILDPALPDDVKARTAKAYREAAVADDARLWDARMRLALDDAEQRGAAEAVEPMKKLSAEFKDEPEVLENLAGLYGRLGWRAERLAAFSDLARRFPDDVAALRAYLEAIDDDGALGDADVVAARIKQLDPDSEVDLDRAMARQDWPAAIAELRRLAKRRPDRKEIAARIADVLSRSGDPRAAASQLEKALAKNPRDGAARFRLADDAYAKGHTDALRRALADALQVGADGSDLRAAIDLLEGATDLEPYRKDGREIIKQFEAWEKSGKHMDGTSARVLDYGATWVHIGGSSEMLEHEIQRIQSQEGINDEATIEPPSGLVLHLRVIKPDGTTLEPEQIAGKSSLTFPHLEVGDYIELEHITPEGGDGMKGRHYLGPTWFFREPNKGYWQSEFVVVTPKEKEAILEVEHRGDVGQDTTRDLGMFVEHRWRVDLSPPAPTEPDAPLHSELLPSVRVGWGITREDMLSRFAELAVDDTPLDPRLRRVADNLVKGTTPNQTEERARLLYRYAVDTVQSGKESDGRKVLIGHSGSTQSAYTYLLRLMGIPEELAIARNSLATPPLGKLSDAEDYDPFRPHDPEDDPRRASRDPRAGMILRVTTEHGVRWLEIGDKFMPFGYVPASYRGQPAFRLVPGTPGDTVPTGGPLDGISYRGRADVREDGSAMVDLEISFGGKVAIGLRSGIAETPEARRIEVIERSVVAPTFAGGHLREMHIEHLAEVDVPVVLHLKVEAPELAKPVAQGLSLHAVFDERLDKLAELPERQTPLLRVQSFHTEVHLEVSFPDKLRMPATLPNKDVTYGGCTVSVKDTVAGHAIYLERVIDIPAGRVQPGDDYAAYQRFARDADAAYEREVIVGRQ